MKRNIKSNEGYTMVVTLIVMLVLMSLVASVLFLADNNTKQMDVLEENLRSYYLARSGIEIGYAAIMSTDKSGVKKILTLIDEETTVLKETDLELPTKGTPIGSVDIEISLVGDEVRIYSKGTLSDTNSTSELALYINKSNFTKTRWERE